MTVQSRLRVLHLAKFYPPVRGGMERVLLQLCESTQPVVDNLVLAAHETRGTVQERVNGVSVTRMSRWAKVGSVSVCPTFPWWLRRTQADLTVLHEPNAPALVADLVTPSSPVLVWYHADLVRPSWIYESAYRPLLNRVLRRAVRIIVSSPRLAEHAEGLAGFREKCSVVPFGVDPATYDAPVEVPDALRRFRTQQGERTMVLMVGRLVPYKGIDVLLRALRATEVAAVIVGVGPLQASLQRLANELDVADRVLFAGNLSDTDLVAAYHFCDVFVLPSVTRQEAFGVVQLEAMACGKPVICTDLPTGVPWVNRHGESGLVVPPRDSAALASALNCLVEDPLLRRRLGEGARKRVFDEFTLERTTRRALDIYRDAAGLQTGSELAASRPAATASRV